MRAILVPADPNVPVQLVEVAEPERDPNVFLADELAGTPGPSPFLADVYKALGTTSVGRTLVHSLMPVWIDDDGLLKALPVNERLTALRDASAVAAGHPEGYPSEYPLVGPGLMVGPADDYGNESAVLPWVVEMMLKVDAQWHEHDDGLCPDCRAAQDEARS